MDRPRALIRIKCAHTEVLKTALGWIAGSAQQMAVIIPSLSELFSSSIHMEVEVVTHPMSVGEGNAQSKGLES